MARVCKLGLKVEKMTQVFYCCSEPGHLICDCPIKFLGIVRISKDRRVRLNSPLRFFRRELLRELFSPHNHKKWVHDPLLNFSVHPIVDQIADVNAPI